MAEEDVREDESVFDRIRKARQGADDETSPVTEQPTPEPTSSFDRIRQATEAKDTEPETAGDVVPPPGSVFDRIRSAAAAPDPTIIPEPREEAETAAVTPTTVATESDAPELPAGVWASDAQPVWVEDWGDWAWTYKAPDTAPNAGTQYTWDSAGNLVATPERIREAQSVAKRNERRADRPAWWDAEEEEAALGYVNEVATTRNVATTNDDGSPRDLLELTQDVYRSYVTSEEDRNAYLKKIQKAQRTGVIPEYTEADERVRNELLQASAFVDRVFPSDGTRSAREEYEGRRNVRLADDLTRLVQQTATNEQLSEAVQRYNETQRTKNRDRREAEEMINELHFGITDDPSMSQRISRAAFGTPIRGISQGGLLPEAPSPDQAAESVTDEYVSAYDAHLKRQASSDRISQLDPEKHTDSPYIVDVGDEARSVLDSFGEDIADVMGVKVEDRVERVERRYRNMQMYQEIAGDLDPGERDDFYKHLKPIISDISAVAIMREIAEQGEVATPARIAAYAQKYTRDVDDMALLVAKHIPLSEQIQISRFSAPSAYKASQEIAAGEAEERTLTDEEALSLLRGDPAFFEAENLPEEFKDATIRDRVAWISLRRDVDQNISDEELIEQWRTTSDGRAIVDGLTSRLNRFRRVQEYQQDAQPTTEIDGPAALVEGLNVVGSPEANAATRQQYQREMNVFREEARRFLKRTGQTVSKHKVDAIAWGMMTQTIPQSLRVLSSVAQVPEVEQQPETEYQPDMLSEETRNLKSPMPAADPEETAEARQAALQELREFGTMFEDTTEASSPFMEGADESVAKQFNEKYEDVLPFPARHEYTQDSILEATGVEGFYLRKALRDIHSSGIALDPAVVYQRAVFYFNMDPRQTAYRAASQAQTEQLNLTARRARLAEMREKTDNVRINWVTTAEGTTAVETPMFYQRLLQVVRNENPWQEWKKDYPAGMNETDLYEIYDEQMRFEAQSLLADKIMASQGTVFYMPYSDRTVAQMARNAIPDWASPLRVLYASLVPVINTNDALDPGWATGGRPLTYGDLKNDNWLWQVFNVLPTNYLAVGARYGVGEMLNPSDEALTDVAGGLNTFTAFGDIQDVFTNMYTGVGLPEGIAEELAFWTGVGGVGYFAFKEPDPVIGAMAGVRSLAGIRKSGKDALRAGEAVADALARFASESAAAGDDLVAKEAALGELMQALGERAGASQQWYLEAGQSLAEIWGDDLYKLDGVLGLDTDHNLVQTLRTMSDQRESAEQFRDSLLRKLQDETLTDEMKAAIESDAIVAQERADHLRYIEADIDYRILFTRRQQMQKLLGDEDLTSEIISRGITIFDQEYVGQPGLNRLMADVDDLRARIELQELNVGQALAAVLPRSPMWARRPRQAHTVYTPQADEAIRGVGEVRYPIRIIEQPLEEAPTLRLGRRPGFPTGVDGEIGILRPKHDSLDNVAFRLREAMKVQVKLEEAMQASLREFSMTADEIEKSRRTLDEVISRAVSEGASPEFRARAGELFADHQKTVARILDEIGTDPTAPKRLIAEYRRFQIKHREIVEQFAEADARVRNTLWDMATERRRLQGLYEQMQDHARANEKIFSEFSSELTKASRVEDQAWVETLLARRKELKKEREILERFSRIYGDQSETSAAFDRLNQAKADWENSNTRVLSEFRAAGKRKELTEFELNVEFLEAERVKAIREIRKWSNTEWMPIAYRQLEKKAKDLERQTREQIKLIKGQFAEKVASAAGKLSANLEELVVEIPTDELRAHAKQIARDLQLMLPPEQAAAIWNTTFMLPAKAFARNTGRMWEEWLYTNVKEIVFDADGSVFDEFVERNMREGYTDDYTGILLQTAEQGDAPIFYSQLQDVVLPRLFDGRSAIPVQELKSRLYKLKPDGSITPRSVKVDGKQQSVSLDELQWTGMQGYLDDIEQSKGPRYKVTYEEINEYLDVHSIKVSTHTKTTESYASADAYRMPGGSRRDGRTFHIQWKNRPGAEANRGFRPERYEVSTDSHWSYTDHVGWARTTVRDVIVGGVEKTVLFIDEIQSDWMQRAGKEGMQPITVEPFRPLVRIMVEAMDETVDVGVRLGRVQEFKRRYPSKVVEQALDDLEKALIAKGGSSEVASDSAAADKLVEYLSAYNDETLPDGTIKIRVGDFGVQSARLDVKKADGTVMDSDVETRRIMYQTDTMSAQFELKLQQMGRLADALPKSRVVREDLYTQYEFDLRELIGVLRDPDALAPPSPRVNIDRIMDRLNKPDLHKSDTFVAALAKELGQRSLISPMVRSILADVTHGVLTQMSDSARVGANLRSLTAREKGLLDTWFEVFRTHLDEQRVPMDYRRRVSLTGVNQRLLQNQVRLLPYYNIVTDSGNLDDAFRRMARTFGADVDPLTIEGAIAEGIAELNHALFNELPKAGPLMKTWKDVVFKRVLRQALDDGLDGVAFSPSFGNSAASGGFWAGIDAHTNILIKNARRYTEKTWSTADDPIEWTYASFPIQDHRGISSVSPRLGERQPRGATESRSRLTPEAPEDAWMVQTLNEMPEPGVGRRSRPIRGLTYREHGALYARYFLRVLARTVPEKKAVIDDFIKTVDELGGGLNTNPSFVDEADTLDQAVAANINELTNVITETIESLSSTSVQKKIFGDDFADYGRAEAWIGELADALAHIGNYSSTSDIGKTLTRLLTPLDSVDVMLFNKSIRESSRTQRLLQKASVSGGIKGATEFLEDGRAIIYGFKTGDISTIIHEMGHVIRRTLSRDQQLAIRRWISSSTDTPFEKTVNEFGEWTVASEEAFARGFERMFAPKPLKQTFDLTDIDVATADAFRTVRTFMSKVYDDLEKRKILGDALNPEARRTMNEVMGLNQRVDILDLYGPGRRISRTLFKAKIQNVLDNALGKDTPHAMAGMFLDDLQEVLGGAEAEILRRLTSDAAGDVVIDGKDLQALYELLDEMPEHIKRYHITKAGIAGGAAMMGVLGNKFLQRLYATKGGVIRSTIAKTQQFFDPEGTRFGIMKDEVVELTKAHANMQRQATDELNLILRNNRTPETFKKVMLDYVDGQVPIRTPNGYTVFNQGPLSLFRHLQKFVEDHPYYSPERRANVDAALAKAEREALEKGRRLSNNEKLKIREEFEQADDLSAKTEALRALARMFVHNTERYPIGGAAAMDLEEVAYKLLTGVRNTAIKFKSLKDEAGKPITLRMGVDTATTFPGKTIHIKPVNSMAEFMEEMKKAHKVITNYRHRMPGTVYKSTDEMAGELPAVAPMHEALDIAVKVAGHAKIMNETVNDYRKIFGLLTEEEAFKINRMIEDPNSAIDALDTIGSRYIALQRTSGARRTRMESRHKQMVELSRKMVAVSKTTDGESVFMPYDLARQFDANMTALIKDLDAITPEGALRSGVPGLDLGARFAKGYLSWWRQSVLTGLLLPNPRYWVNNIVGDMSQMMTSIGIGPASRLSFQNLFSNIEAGPFKPHTYLLKKTEELAGKPVLGSMMNALFNPRLHNVWSGKNGFMILPDGRQLPYSQLRDWLVKDGILDSFTQAELATEMRKVMEKQKWWTSGVDLLRNWQFDIQAHATMVQQRQRTALYLDLLERGYSRKEAKDLTLEALYDWRNSLGQAEMNSVTMMFLPFWRFHKLAMKQMGVALFEAYTMPGKEYWKKMATGRTKWTRLRGQAQIVNNIPHIVSPAEREDWTETEGRLNLMARLFTPPWAGRLHSWNVPGRLNAAEWDWMKDNLGHAQSFDRAGYRIWYGPQLTATHQLQLFNSFFSLFTAGTAMAVGLGKHGDAGYYLTDGWERQAIEPWTGMMHRPFQAFTTAQLQGLGLDPGFVPGRFIPHQGKLTAGEREVFNFIDRVLQRFSDGPTVFAVADEQDAQGRYNANPILTKLWKEIPFFGLQLMGIIDKSQRARAFAEAKFPESNWLEFLYGFAYFTGAWTGIAKPYEFALDKNYAQWIQSLREEVGLAEIPLKNIQTDIDFKYGPG